MTRFHFDEVKKMAARTKRVRLDEGWREKIKAAMVINKLQDHVEGKIEMTPTQITAAKILLAKVLPDLKQTELMGTGPDGEIETISRIERVIVRVGDKIPDVGE
jgi:hypothetical protein